MRVMFVELPHLSVGAPTQIAVAGIAQVDVCELGEPAARVAARGHFVADRFVVDKAIGASRADGQFVKAHRVMLAALDTSNLRGYQCGAVLKILRAVLRPDLQLSVMGS